MAGSYWLALIFQTSHVISEVRKRERDRQTELISLVFTRLNGQNLIKTIKFMETGKTCTCMYSLLCSQWLFLSINYCEIVLGASSDKFSLLKLCAMW